MTKQQTQWTKAIVAVCVVAVCALTLSGIGCDDRRQRRRPTASRQTAKDDSAFLVDTVADGLNNLPREIVLDLTPPAPILDDSRSVDGQPVMATCSETPGVTGGGFNYLEVPKRNAGFRKLGVRRGDIVRYFADSDEEGAEHGYAQTGFFELTVRRLDQSNPENALIVEGGLSGPLPLPHRLEIWRFSDKRMNEIRQRITRYIQRPKKWIGWEPSPDETGLAQLLERTNQWLRNFSGDDSTWQAEPLVEELPADLRKTKQLVPLLKKEAMAYGQFDETEGRQLQQAIWLRDVSRWAAGEAVSPVEIASALFDWTVRNIQLERDGSTGWIHQPWQILMYGRGTAQQRAWVFAELCRQQQLDVVMLAVDGKWWLSALLHEGQLYLFDARLGLAIPGNEDSSVATLQGLIDEPALLERLNVDGEDDYPVTEDSLGSVEAWLVASPLQLSKRAALLQGVLEGDDYVELSANTRAAAEALAKVSGVTSVQLWTVPLQSIVDETTTSENDRVRAAQQFIVFAQRPRLWKARVLHFQGTKAIPIEERNDPLARPELGHQQATALYQDPRIRPPNNLLETIEPAKRVVYTIAKANASYWLGLLSYDLGKYKVAEDWLKRRTLEAMPDGPWANGARYNLARAYEALGDLPAAIKLLESDDSPQRLGNLIRARQLQGRLDSGAAESE